MTTIKSFTSLEQSKKLAEILPIESADAFYIIGKEPVDIVVIYGFVTHKHLKEQMAYKRAVPCWSLAALLNRLPFPILYMEMVAGMILWCCECHFIETDEVVKIEHCDNPVDACVAMIEKLHELNL